MYEVGEIQISPASSYKDRSLNPARQDDELAIERRMASEGVRISIKGPGTEGFQELSGVIGDLKRTHRTEDYYVYCMALSRAPQLFDDFDADSYVVIRESSAFIERLKDSGKRQLPGWRFRSGCVKYIESYPTSPRDFMKPGIDLCFTKLRSYSYQQEYRFVWLPPPDQERQNPLKAFKIQLGSLEQIAELVVK